MRGLSSLASRASSAIPRLSKNQSKPLIPTPNSEFNSIQSSHKNPRTNSIQPSSSGKSSLKSKIIPIDHNYISQILARKDWILLLNHELKAQRISLNPQFITSVLQNQNNPSQSLLFYAWVSNLNSLFTKNQSITGALANVLYRKGPVLLSPNLIQNIRTSGCKITEDLLCLLVNSWGKLGLSKYCNEVFEQISYLGLNPSTRLYNAVISALISSNSLDSAYLKLQQMHSDNCRPDRFTYNILIHGVCKIGLVDEALRLMKEMPKSGYSPNVFTYTILIDGFCNAKRVDEAFSVLQRMKQSNIKPNEATFRSLVNGVFRSVSSEKAFEVFYEFVDKVPVLPKALCDSMLYSLSNSTLYRESAVFIRKILKRGYVPDSSLFNITVTCLIKGLDIDEICELFDGLTKRGLKAGFSTYMALVEALYGTGKVEIGDHYLKKMFEEGLVVNVFSYNIIIDCFVKSNMINKASETYGEMVQRNIRPNLVTFNSLINGQFKSGEVGEAAKILQKLIEYGFKPDLFTFSSIIDGLCRVYRIDDAFDCFKEMVDWKVKPNNITYNIMIRGFCVIGDSSKAMVLLRSMRNEGIKPDVYSLNALIQSYCRTNKFDKAQKILVTMTDLDLKPDNITYSAFITALCKSGRFREAKELFWSMDRNGCSPDYHTCKLFVDFLVESNRYDEAANVRRRCKDRGIEL